MKKCVLVFFASLISVLSSGLQSSLAKGRNSDLFENSVLYEDNEDDISDPLYKYNKIMFAINSVLDKMFFEPIATGYKKFVPNFVQVGMENFVSNTFSPVRAINFALQGNGEQFIKTMIRFPFNFIFGFFGFFDPAKVIGITAENTDFGQTMKKWKIKPGPYIVLPIFGPTSMRGMAGRIMSLPLDTAVQISFLRYRKNIRRRIYYVLFGMDLLISRAKILNVMKDLYDIYDDKYIAVRTAVMHNEMR